MQLFLCALMRSLRCDVPRLRRYQSVFATSATVAEPFKQQVQVLNTISKYAVRSSSSSRRLRSTAPSSCELSKTPAAVLARHALAVAFNASRHAHRDLQYVKTLLHIASYSLHRWFALHSCASGVTSTAPLHHSPRAIVTRTQCTGSPIAECTFYI